eukprot:1499882-Amphidinium_carterae.1
MRSSPASSQEAVTIIDCPLSLEGGDPTIVDIDNIPAPVPQVCLEREKTFNTARGSHSHRRQAHHVLPVHTYLIRGLVPACWRMVFVCRLVATPFMYFDLIEFNRHAGFVVGVAFDQCRRNTKFVTKRTVTEKNGIDFHSVLYCNNVYFKSNL